MVQNQPSNQPERLESILCVNIHIQDTHFMEVQASQKMDQLHCQTQTASVGS